MADELKPKESVLVEGRPGQVLRKVETQRDTYVILFDQGETEWFHISMIDRH